MSFQKTDGDVKPGQTTVVAEQARLAWERPVLRTIRADEAKTSDNVNTDGAFHS